MKILTPREILLLIASYVGRERQEQLLAEELAAAEERGRRRGVEEQADLLLECEEALVWCSAADAFSPDGIAVKGWQRIVVPVLERIRAVRKNLAPRDSGKEG